MSSSPPLKTVCIIGAGPSGLVAAKTLTHSHPNTFHVTVLEQSPHIGGLWPVSRKENAAARGMVNPEMRTNQSRHTVSFSDLAWKETDPVFPRAWEVGAYLQRYVSAYPGFEIRTGCKVVRTAFEGDVWRVWVRDVRAVDNDGQGEVLEFHHVIVASGFFGAPRIPEGLDVDCPFPVVHSSRFRDVDALLDSGRGRAAVQGKRIVVVGGQMSGFETAAAVAMQLSSAVNSPPGVSGIPNIDEFEVIHVIQNPIWVMPLFFPRNPVREEVGGVDGKKAKNEFNPAPDFLPLDLVCYNLDMRPAGQLLNNGGHITLKSAMMQHVFMKTYLGNDQSDIGYPELAIIGLARSRPPFLAVSDQYTEFVRSGNIKILKGKVRNFQESHLRTVKVEDEVQGIPTGNSYPITDVAAVILATGFEASPSINFLPSEILDALQFDSTCDEFPLALNVHAVVSCSLPSLGFVGFYRSPYWGVMEMQARFLGQLWSGNPKAAKALAQDKTMDTMLKLRRDPRRGQFPMGDYSYLMESFGEILGMTRLQAEPANQSRRGLVFPPRYTYDKLSGSEGSETAAALTAFTNDLSDSEKGGRFLSRAVFRALQGDWKLERKIESFIDTYPSGNFSGIAKFMPRLPTDADFDKEYLYVENGEFTTRLGHKFSAKRSYAHRYCEATDKLSAWFIKQDDKTVDYFFHDLEFILPQSTSGAPQERSGGWKAKAFHLCTPDTYDVNYEFKFRGVALEEWTMAYTVKGPQKDYFLSSTYTRFDKPLA